MKPNTVSWFVNLVARALSNVISKQVSDNLVEATHEARRLSDPLARALVDAFLADRIVSATWPSAVVFGALLSLHSLTFLTSSPELLSNSVGLVVLTAYVWSVYGLVIGAKAAWPNFRFWFVTRLPPVRHVRLLIFQYIRVQHAAITAMKTGTGFKQDILATALQHFEEANRVGPNQLAFKLANYLAPVVVGHLLKRVFLLIVPILSAIVYYRLVIYPDIIAKNTTIGPWSIAMYPLATIVDVVAGTHLRGAL